jgi:hypothetical protein
MDFAFDLSLVGRKAREGDSSYSQLGDEAAREGDNIYK